MADDTGAAPAAAAGSSPAPSATTSTAAVTPASATATPATTESAATEPGPIPFDRHKSILDGAYKERDSYKQQLDQLAWAQQFQSDPYPYVDQWVDQLAAHPQYQAQILAKAAKLLASRRGQGVDPSAQEPQPDIPLVDQHGNPTGQFTYSAKQQKAWQDWQWQQREAALAERIQPLEQLAQQVQQQQVIAQIQQESVQQAQATLGELRQDPLFATHEPDIKRALMDHPEWGDNVHRAFAYVLKTKALPNEQAKVLESLKTQANGGTVNPGQTAPSQAPKFKGFGDALRYYAEHPDEAAAMANR